MAYRIKIQQIGRGGTASGGAVLYEAETEMEAIAVATYEVDIGCSGQQRIATVSTATGQLVLAYVGRMRAIAHARRR